MLNLPTALATLTLALGLAGLQPLPAASQTAARSPVAAPARNTSDASLLIEGRSLKGGVSQLTLDFLTLDRLPQRSFTTNTPWVKQPQTFSGPLLRDVLATAGAVGSNIKAVALNDYQINIPVDDAQKFDVVVALRIDGKPIPVRERGPFFVIYPFDQHPELRAVRYYERSIWQLKSLRVE